MRRIQSQAPKETLDNNILVAKRSPRIRAAHMQISSKDQKADLKKMELESMTTQATMIHITKDPSEKKTATPLLVL